MSIFSCCYLITKLCSFLLSLSSHLTFAFHSKLQYFSSWFGHIVIFITMVSSSLIFLMSWLFLAVFIFWFNIFIIFIDIIKIVIVVRVVVVQFFVLVLFFDALNPFVKALKCYDILYVSHRIWVIFWAYTYLHTWWLFFIAI